MILGTEILIALMAGDPKAAAKIAELESRGIPAKISSITFFELLTLAEQSGSGENVLLVKSIIDNVHCIYVNPLNVAFATELDESLSMQEKLLVGAALANNERLVSRNPKLEKIRGLKLEPW